MIAKKIRMAALVMLTLMLALVFVMPIAPAMAQDEVSALFINVGKADAALFFLGEKRFLVDTGTSDSLPELKKALEVYNVTKLDGIIITHTDKDHVGGLKRLVKGGFPVDMLYAGALHSESSDAKHPVYQSSQSYGVPMTWLSAGDTIDLGNGCVFHVLGPLSQDMENENNNSLVLRLETPHGSMLLTGDMELEEEAELLNNGLIEKATVLKVAHHGEDDATGRQFVLTVRPQWAVISTSTAEERDTPDSKIIARLWEVHSGVAVTQDAEIGILVTLENATASAQSISLQK